MEGFNYYKKLGADGDLKKLYGIDMLIDSIVNYLSIPKGNYPGDPEYGSELYKYVWEPADDVTKEGIHEEIKDVSSMFDNNARISNLSVNQLSDKKGYIVSFDIIYLGETKSVTLEVTGDYVSRLG